MFLFREAATPERESTPVHSKSTLSVAEYAPCAQLQNPLSHFRITGRAAHCAASGNETQPQLEVVADSWSTLSPWRWDSFEFSRAAISLIPTPSFAHSFDLCEWFSVPLHPRRESSSEDVSGAGIDRFP